jgi:hypothetical protein
VSKSRSQSKRRPKISAEPVSAPTSTSAASLPLPQDGATLLSPVNASSVPETPKKQWTPPANPARDGINERKRPLTREDFLPETIYVSDASSIKDKCRKIYGLKLLGWTADEIGKHVGLAPATIHNYMYRAGRNGWIDEWSNAKEHIEYGLVPKAIRNLNEALDSDIPTVRQEFGLEIAKHTIFKEFGQESQKSSPLNIIGVRVEVVPGAVTEVRAGTTGGRPAFIEAEEFEVE